MLRHALICSGNHHPSPLKLLPRFECARARRSAEVPRICQLPAAPGSTPRAQITAGSLQLCVLRPAVRPLQHLTGTGGCGEPLASITNPRASQMLQPETCSMCECASTSAGGVCSWQEEAAGAAREPADSLQVQRRAAGRLPGASAGQGKRHRRWADH